MKYKTKIARSSVLK